MTFIPIISARRTRRFIGWDSNWERTAASRAGATAAAGTGTAIHDSRRRPERRCERISRGGDTPRTDRGLQCSGPQHQDAAQMNHERMHVNAVILPDRTVIAVGGGVTREASVKPAVVDPQGGREVFEAEIYDPA